LYNEGKMGEKEGLRKRMDARRRARATHLVTHAPIACARECSGSLASDAMP
jgi:hypothetical protein